MTTPESRLWISVKPYLSELGKAVRLENAAAESLPDVAVICPRTTFWIELKITRGHRVRMPKFQHIFARDIAERSPLRVWMMAIYHDDLIIIPYNTIKKIEPCKNEKYVEYDIRNGPITTLEYSAIIPFFGELMK